MSKTSPPLSKVQRALLEDLRDGVNRLVLRTTRSLPYTFKSGPATPQPSFELHRGPYDPPEPVRSSTVYNLMGRDLIEPNPHRPSFYWITEAGKEALK